MAYTFTEVDKKMEDFVVLFKYIDDKDIFQKFYSRSLAKRLIQSSSISNDAEMTLISRLKVSLCFCG